MSKTLELKGAALQYYNTQSELHPELFPRIKRIAGMALEDEQFSTFIAAFCTAPTEMHGSALVVYATALLMENAELRPATEDEVKAMHTGIESYDKLIKDSLEAVQGALSSNIEPSVKRLALSIACVCSTPSFSIVLCHILHTNFHKQVKETPTDQDSPPPRFPTSGDSFPA